MDQTKIAEREYSAAAGRLFAGDDAPLRNPLFGLGSALIDEFREAELLRKEAEDRWLKDLRQWWRRTGRDLTMPVDGVSTATKPVGKHAMSFSEGSKALPKLAAGSYKLVIEAAREVGGRELVSVPFDWPPKQATTLTATGKEELGAISVTLKP